MKMCRSCGFPRGFSNLIKWSEDGTLAGEGGKKNYQVPFFFMEVEEWENLFSQLSKTLGVPIDHILIEAQRQIGKILVKLAKEALMGFDINIARIPANSFFRPEFLIKLLMRAAQDYLSVFGTGLVELIEYKPRCCLTLGFTHPYAIPMIVGNCLGIYESVEDMPSSRAEYEFSDGKLIIHEYPVMEKPEFTQRLQLDRARKGSAELEYSTCGLCGVPIEAGRALNWDFGQGIIVNRISGEREGMVATQSMNAMLRELVKELGEEIEDILYDIEKNYVSGSFLVEREKEAKALFDHHLRDLALRGMGYPSHFEMKKDSVSIEIENAFNPVLYAAKIASFLEHSLGWKSDIKWETREPSYSKYVISAT